MLEALGPSTPHVREAILNGLLSRRDRFPAVLDAIEQKVLSPSDLSALQRSALIEDGDSAVRRRAKALFSSVGKVDEKVFERYVKALEGNRDPARGQVVFREKCAACHQAHGVGVSVGPDLSAEFQRAEETIVRDILAPSDTISPGYRSISISTHDGRVFVGLLASESPTSVTLRQPEGKDLVILRKDIDEFHSASVSLMPENLFEMLPPSDAADVIAWLRRPQTNLVLLDENRDLAGALNEGKGTAEFITSDRHSGQASLRVTPPQRYSPRIEGWSFNIREKPGPGEYRFVRFAWKSEGAAGVMLEFAAGGQWPPAEKALRRYHAGNNTTGWQSVEVSPGPPRQWTVVTRDLWKDFGDFTLTGIAPTTMGGPALFDRIELLQTPEGP
jgi:putative heme-binding domain-containing protein